MSRKKFKTSNPKILKLSIGILILTCFGFIYANITDIYKTGTLILTPDPEFGKKTDWDSLFYDTAKEIAIAPDGSIFISNKMQHNISKFDKNGKLIKTFAQKGVGPSDLLYPSNLSILDDKYLVVGEYASSRRISLFDLNGNFVKVIKTIYQVFSPLALKNNKIALIKHTTPEKDTTHYIILIRDIQSGNDIEVTSFTGKDKPTLILGKTRFCPWNCRGDVYLARTGNGNLLVGFSLEKNIFIYSPDGKLIEQIKLDISPVRVNSNMIEEFKKRTLENMREQHFPDNIIKGIKRVSFDNLMPEYLPFFNGFLITDEDDIWVLGYTHFIQERNNRVQVYSITGKPLGNFTIDFGEFSNNINAPMVFHNKCIYGLFEKKNSDDISLRIIKINL